MRPPADRPQTLPQLRECPACGLLQTVPALMPGMTARCARCPTTLRRASSPSPGPHHRPRRGCVRIAGRHVLDDVDERPNRRHQAHGEPVFGARGAGSPEHGRARGGGRVRHRAGAAPAAGRHALRADPIARAEAASPSAPRLRPCRAVAPVVDDRGLRLRRLRRLCEARRSGDDRARGRRLRALGPDLCPRLDGRRTRPRSGVGAGWTGDAKPRAARDRRAVRRAQSAARPAVWSACPGRTIRAARAARARCTSASRTAWREPGPWSSPPLFSTSRQITTRCCRWCSSAPASRARSLAASRSW